MTLLELRNNLRRYASSKGIEDEVFDILREKPDIIKRQQERQLFKQSVDAKGQPLGFYSHDHENMPKSKGQPFTMIESGDFKSKLSVFVKGGNEVVITSFTPHLQDMLNNPAFDSTNFFGLTGQSMGVVKRQVLIELKKRLKWKLIGR